MSKKSPRILSAKRVRKTIRKNPITIGATAALLAIGGIAAEAFRRSPQLRERSRDLKEGLMKRLHVSTPAEQASSAAATNPY